MTALGWRPCFAEQVAAEDSALTPLRVVAVHRRVVVASDGASERRLPLGGAWFQGPAEERPTVGDWVLADAGRDRIERCLARQNLVRRMAAGDRADVQAIGANVDAAFVVTSCTAEFSLARLQRFLAVAADAGIKVLVVLTKADLAAQPERFNRKARAAAPGVPTTLVDARDPGRLGEVRKWLRPAHTFVLLGASGVGKSTLLNSLAGRELQTTRPVREDDARGRHTTTHRSLHRVAGGALLLDCPGLRELGIAVRAGGVEDVFEDIEALARSCRFVDCRHDREPGCALAAAVAEGRLPQARLHAYRELERERQSHASALAARSRRRRVRRRGGGVEDDEGIED